MITNLEELYQYRKRTLEIIIPEIEKLLAFLDEEVYNSGACKFKRAFSSNSYWFVITILDNLDRSAAFLNRNCNDLSTNPVSINDIWLNKFRGNGNIKSANLNFISRKNKDRIKAVLAFKEKFKFKKDSFLVMQDGYEVAELKKYMKDFNFIKPMIMPTENLILIKNKDYLESFNKIEFIESKFNIRSHSLYKFLNSYYQNIVLAFDQLYFNYEMQMMKIKPKALFYSIGPNTPFEEMFADIAFKNNIPIFCFQHCGDRRYASNPLVKYFEASRFGDVTINRIDIEEYGSMKLYSFYKNKITDSKKKKDVLYICSSPLETEKEYLLNIPLNMQQNNHMEIISACLKCDYKIDIKPHPLKEEEQVEFLINLISGMEDKVKILTGVKSENIIDKYKIIILDFIQSATTDPALLSNANVIFYLKDKTIITGADLLDKINVDIVSNQKELENNLNCFFYKRNKKRIISGKYYNINPDNPAIKIVDKINELI